MRRVSGFRLNRAWKKKPALKGKDPSGGTTGRVKPYGRLGWMGARAEYSRWGGITAPTLISRSRRAGRSKHQAIFLTFLFRGSDGFPADLPRISEQNHRVAGRLGSFAADL